MSSWQGLMRRTWVRIADGLTQRAGAVMAVALLVSVVLAFGATKLKFATGQDSYLNKTPRSPRTTAPTRTSSAARR